MLSGGCFCGVVRYRAGVEPLYEPTICTAVPASAPLAADPRPLVASVEVFHKPLAKTLMATQTALLHFGKCSNDFLTVAARCSFSHDGC